MKAGIQRNKKPLKTTGFRVKHGMTGCGKRKINVVAEPCVTRICELLNRLCSYKEVNSKRIINL